MENNETTEQQPLGYMESYFNAVNPLGVVYNNPKLRYNIEEDFKPKLDVDDPMFKSLYEAADADEKRALLGATSVSHAMKIAERRDIQRKSLEIVNQDPLVVQFAVGAIPALLDPVNAIPIGGAAAKTFSVFKTANKLSTVAKVAGTTAVVGGVSNALSEAAFGAQGMETHYMSAFFFGAAFGGTIGGIGAALHGPYGTQMANAMTSKEFENDFNIEPSPNITVQDGVVKVERAQGVEDIGKQTSFGMDTILDFVRSDGDIVYQSNSLEMRKEASKITTASVSLKDQNGNTIPTPKTGEDDKIAARGILNGTIDNVTKAYNEAKESGYKGSREDFVQEVTDVYVQAANNQEFEAYRIAQQKTQDFVDANTIDGVLDKKVASKVESTFRKELNKAYEELEVKFNHKLDAVNRAAEEYRAYYSKMLERGQQRGVTGLKDVNPNKIYRPRTYDYKKVKEFTSDEVYTMVRDGLASHPNQAGVASSTIDLAAQELTEHLMKGSFSLDYLTTSFVATDRVPFDAMLKQRKWKIDENKIRPILRDNLDEVTGAYHYKMSGRQALGYVYGHDDMQKISQDFEDRLIAEGSKHTARELQAYNRLLEDLVGTLRMNQLSDTPKWTFTRNLASFNTARLGGGFGGNQFIEAASAVLMNGANGILDGRFGTVLKTSAKALFGNKEVEDDFAKALVNMGYLDSVLYQHRASRMADDDFGFNSGAIENTLQGFNEKLMKYNGVRYFMGVMEDMTGGAIMEQITKLSKSSSIGGADKARLARWGLTERDAKAIAKDIEKYYNPKEGRFELDKFSEANRDKLQLAISRGIREVVVQGDSIHLPAWMKAPGAATKLFTQFMRFPLIANNILLKRGMTEDKARLIGGAIASTMTYMGLKYLREQASIALGFTEEVDAKYDYFGFNGEENRMRALQESLNYTAQLGMFTTGWNLGATTLGFPELGRDYANNRQAEALFGPTFGGTIPDVLSIMSDAAQGEFNERSALKTKSLMLGNNLPLINEGMKYMIEEGL
jgi:hypothetical protein